MLLDITLLAVGFILLIEGADVFVEGTSKVAAMLHIPQIIIELTIVTFRINAPETAVGIASAYKGTADIMIGDIIGSNITGVLLILNISDMISILAVKKSTFFIETPFVIVTTIALLFLGYSDDSTTKVDGGILWVFFLLFLFYLYHLTRHGDDSAIDDVSELDDNDRMRKLAVLIILDIICVVIGSQVTVDATSSIAQSFGANDRIIGLTIVSIGTSLPELVTSVSASLKGKNDITIGNIIENNIFGILFVLGTTSLVAPHDIPFASNFLLDGLIAIVAIVIFMIFIGRDIKLKKYDAFIMLISYVCYLVYIL